MGRISTRGWLYLSAYDTKEQAERARAIHNYPKKYLRVVRSDNPHAWLQWHLEADYAYVEKMRREYREKRGY